MIAGMAALSELGGYYAAAIADRFPDATVLFGPAYKGITLAARPVDGRALIDGDLRVRIDVYLQQYAPR